MTNLNDTTKLHALRDSRATARDILQHVYRALQAKGYDPITQLTGFILTGDPTYITSFDNARSMINDDGQDRRAGCGRRAHWHRGVR